MKGEEFLMIKMPRQNFYWIESKEEENSPTERDILKFKAEGVIEAGVYFVTKGDYQGYLTKVLPIKEYHNDINRLVICQMADRDHRLIFSGETLIACLNIGTDVGLTKANIRTLDILMKGIGMLSLGAR
jgi:hypothetical protein